MFGFSFGAKKTSTNEKTDSTSLTNTNQTQTSNENASTKGTQNTSQTGSSQSQGSSATTGTTTNDQTQQGRQTGTTTQFDQQSLAGIQDLFAKLLGSQGSGAGAQLADKSLAAQGNFDPGKYVSGVVDAARADTLTSLEEAVNGNASQIGGVAGTNSAAAMLASRLENNRAATLGGIESEANKTVQGILAQNSASGTAAQASGNQFLAQLGELLKGGTTSTDQASTAATSGSGTTTSGTTTSESSQQQQNTNTQTTQDVLTQILATLQGTESKVGSTTSVGKSTSMGGGISGSM